MLNYPAEQFGRQHCQARTGRGREDARGQRFEVSWHGRIVAPGADAVKATVGGFLSLPVADCRADRAWARACGVDASWRAVLIFPQLL